MPATTKSPSMEFPEMLTERKAAEILGVKPETLCIWRCVGRYGLPYTKIGHLVRYSREDLMAWLVARRVVPKRRPAKRTSRGR